MIDVKPKSKTHYTYHCQSEKINTILEFMAKKNNVKKYDLVTTMLMSSIIEEAKNDKELNDLFIELFL
jgi:hypothetical protein